MVRAANHKCNGPDWQTHGLLYRNGLLFHCFSVWICHQIVTLMSWLRHLAAAW